jgi:hypothetical protein
MEGPLMDVMVVDLVLFSQRVYLTLHNQSRQLERRGSGEISYWGAVSRRMGPCKSPLSFFPPPSFSSESISLNGDETWLSDAGDKSKAEAKLVDVESR